jgi:hypothetical protein
MDVQRIALRGQLPPATFEIHYTTDGSEPTATSPKYTTPLTFTDPTTVRMLVLRDGAAALKTEAKFAKGLPQVITDPRYEHPTTSPAMSEDFAKKPHDKQLVGDWVEPKRTLRFKDDGTVVRVDRKEETEVGRWWYDYPNDVFEDAADAGHGEMRWNNSGDISQLKLINREAKEMTLTTHGKDRRLKRSP